MYGGHDADNAYQIIYKINNNSTSILTQVAVQKTKVSPTIANRDTDITVDLGTENNGSCKINVVGMNGSIYQTIKVEPNQTQATIKTATLPQGVYVVSVDENGKKHENCKIVIR